MLGQTYYHQTIRKYVILFGTLFNDLSVHKRNSSGQIVSKIKVPIAYGPKQKFITRIGQDPSINRKVAIQLPRMGFEMTAITYDPTRKLNTMGQRVHKTYVNGAPSIKKMFNPVPYLFNFSLFIFVDNAEDGTQILEQILPFFTPEFTTTINVLTEMDLKLDVPLIINGVGNEDVYDGDFSTRRTIIWTIDFTLKGYIYPEIKSGSKIIKSIDVSFRDMDAKTTSSGELYNFALESSTNFSPQFLKLESNTEGQPGTFLLENSASGLSAGNIISNVNVTEFGGEGVDQMGRDDIQTTVTITPFNPYADYNEDTGQFTQ